MSTIHRLAYLEARIHAAEVVSTKEAGFGDVLKKLWKDYKKDHPKSEKPPESLVEKAKDIADDEGDDSPEAKKKQQKKQKEKEYRGETKKLFEKNVKQCAPDKIKGLSDKEINTVEDGLREVRRKLNFSKQWHDEKPSQSDWDELEKAEKAVKDDLKRRKDDKAKADADKADKDKKDKKDRKDKAWKNRNKKPSDLNKQELEDVVKELQNHVHTLKEDPQFDAWSNQDMLEDINKKIKDFEKELKGKKSSRLEATRARLLSALK